MTIITIHMRKNDGLEKKFFFFFFVFSHPGGSVSLPGVRESGRISGRLPGDLGGFTCMPTIIIENKWSFPVQLCNMGLASVVP